MSLIAEISFAAIDDFIDNLLHPRGAASHLRRDKHILRSRPIVLSALEHRRGCSPLEGPKPPHIRILAWSRVVYYRGPRISQEVKQAGHTTESAFSEHGASVKGLP